MAASVPVRERGKDVTGGGGGRTVSGEERREQHLCRSNDDK